MSNDARENLIAQVRAVQAEIEKLGVRPESIRFDRLSVEQLEAEKEAVFGQLTQLKKFRGDL